MLKRIVLLAMLIAVASLAACGLLREPEAASSAIEAIPLELETPAAEPAESEAAVPTEAPATEAVPTAEMVEPTVEAVAPTEEPTAEPVAAEPVVYTIDQAASQVRFELDEDLRGQRITVVGTTDQVAGQIALNLADLSTTQVGVLQINARTLLTDNNFRNRAIQNEILNTGAFEFITFTPVSVEGLPPSAVVGQPVQFTISGDLTIRDTTMPATFNVEATAVSEGQITGTASTVVNRADFGLNIPSVPNVANVEEEVELYINFTANAG
jgi:polyisoprenoid-binding protein YceI